MNNPKISILVAVYNAAQYLPDCLDSLLRQTYRNIEVLCVDDCSTDNSWHILQQYAASDPRIFIWRQQKNEGQAIARNIALGHSTGDIITFLDSDDWLADDALEKMAACFVTHEETDCVLFRLRYVFPDGTETDYRTTDFEPLDGRTAFIKSLTWDIHGVYAVRGNLHRRFPYDQSYRHYSDDNTTRLHYFFSRQVRCCDATYYYRQHDDSVTHVISLSQLDYLRANESMKRQLCDLHCDDDIISIYENERWKNLIGLNLFFEHHKRKFSRDEMSEVHKEIKRVWQTIEPARLFPDNKYKPGYYPFAKAWPLFRLEQTLFCTLRILLKRDIK